jgi:hypothetical protein
LIEDGEGGGCQILALEKDWDDTSEVNHPILEAAEDATVTTLSWGL